MAITASRLDILINVVTQGLESGLKKAEGAIQGIETKTGKISEIGTSGSQGWQNLLGTIGKTNTALGGLVATGLKFLPIIGAIVGIVMAAKEAVQAFAEFEYAMSKIKTLTDVTYMGFVKLQWQVRSLATDTGFSAESLGDALYKLTRQGVDTSNAINVLSDSATLARVAFTDVDTAAMAVTRIMNTMSMSYNESGRAAQILFGIMKEGHTTIENINQGMFETIARGAEYGASLEDMAAILSVVNTKWGNLRNTARMTGQILTQIERPSEKAVQAAAKYGLELGQGTIKAKGLMRTLIDLHEEFKKQPGLFSKIFSGRAALAYKSLGNDIERAAELQRKFLEGGDDLEKAYEEIMGTFQMQWARLKAVLNDFIISLGQALAPALKSLLNVLQPLLELVGVILKGIGLLVNGIVDGVKWGVKQLDNLMGNIFSKAYNNVKNWFKTRKQIEAEEIQAEADRMARREEEFIQEEKIFDEEMKLEMKKIERDERMGKISKEQALKKYKLLENLMKDHADVETDIRNDNLEKMQEKEIEVFEKNKKKAFEYIEDLDWAESQKLERKLYLLDVWIKAFKDNLVVQQRLEDEYRKTSKELDEAIFKEDKEAAEFRTEYLKGMYEEAKELREKEEKEFKEWYEKQTQYIEQLKSLNMISLEEELKMYMDMMDKMEKGSEKWLELQRKNYEIMKTLREQYIADTIAGIEYVAAFENKSTTQLIMEKIRAYDKYLKNALMNVEERKAAEKTLKDLEKQWILERQKQIEEEKRQEMEDVFSAIEHEQISEYEKMKAKMEYLKEYLKDDKMSRESRLDAIKKAHDLEVAMEKEKYEKLKEIEEEFKTAQQKSLEAREAQILESLKKVQKGSAEEQNLEMKLNETRMKKLQEMYNQAGKYEKGFNKNVSKGRYWELQEAKKIYEEMLSSDLLSNSQRIAMNKKLFKVKQELLKEEGKEQQKGRMAQGSAEDEVAAQKRNAAQEEDEAFRKRSEQLDKQLEEERQREGTIKDWGETAMNIFNTANANMEAFAENFKIKLTESIGAVIQKLLEMQNLLNAMFGIGLMGGLGGNLAGGIRNGNIINIGKIDIENADTDNPLKIKKTAEDISGYISRDVMASTGGRK